MNIYDEEMARSLKFATVMNMTDIIDILLPLMIIVSEYDELNGEDKKELIIRSIISKIIRDSKRGFLSDDSFENLIKNTQLIGPLIIEQLYKANTKIYSLKKKKYRGGFLSIFCW